MGKRILVGIIIIIDRIVTAKTTGVLDIEAHTGATGVGKEVHVGMAMSQQDAATKALSRVLEKNQAGMDTGIVDGGQAGLKKSQEYRYKVNHKELQNQLCQRLIKVPVNQKVN